MKRGLTVFPFLLIFVMIAGSIILIFFFSFGTNLFSTSQNVNKLTVLKNIDQQLAAFSFPKNAISTIDLGAKSEINTICSNAQTTFLFKDSTLKSQKIIITPIPIIGKSIQAWTLSWDYPFKIDNIYYLIPGQDSIRNVKFYYKKPQNDNKEAREFIENFRFNIKEIQTIDQVTTPTTDKKIIFLLDSSQSLQSQDLRIVKIGFNQDLSTRKVEIFENNKLILTSSYLGNALALILALSPENYECFKEQASQRLNDIASIYEQKINLLKMKSDNTNCDYTGISDYLEDIKNIANNNIVNLNAPKELEQANKNMKLINCPQLYLQ